MDRFFRRMMPRATVTVLETCREGIDGLRRYGLRSVLGVLGVMLGVASVLTMLSIAEGARTDSLRQVELLGARNLVLANQPLSVADRRSGRPYGLKAEDVRRLMALVPPVTLASPLIERTLPVVGPRATAFVSALSVTETFQDLMGLSVAEGRLLSAADLRTAARRCVLGAALARKLFGTQHPVSSHVRLGGEWFAVAGVLRERSATTWSGSPASRDLNRAVIFPISVVLGPSPDFRPRQPVDEIWLQIGGGSLEALVSGHKSNSCSWLPSSISSNLGATSKTAVEMGIFSNSVTLRIWRSL